MAEESGQTDSPQTVDVTDEASLAEALAQTLELETVPQNETPDEPAAEADGEEGTEEVLSQPEEEEAAADEPAAEESENSDESDTGEATDEEPEDDAEETPRGVQKRIDKLTKRAKRAEETLAEVQAELEQARDAQPDDAPRAPSTTANPFAHVTSLKDVQAEEHSAEQVLDWCDDNPDGAVVQTKDGEMDYSAEEVRDIRKRASKALRKWLPERQAWIQENQAQNEYAHKTYEWWKDKSAAEYQAAQSIIREFPEVMRFPDYKVVVGDQLMGMMMRRGMEAEAKKAKPKTAPKKAPKQPTAPTAEPAPVDETAARSSAARKAFDDSGDVDDLAKLLAAEMQ